MQQLSILLVEDELAISDVVQDALFEAGYLVVSKESAEEAMAILEAKDADFAALVTDINLRTNLTGWDVARRAREHDGDIPIVYMTAASAHEFSSRGVPHSILVLKPFAPSQIVVAVSQLITASDSAPI